MAIQTFEYMFEEEISDEDWSPREQNDEENLQTPKSISFIHAMLTALKEGANTFTCPVCGKDAYCREYGKGDFAATCNGCGIRLMS